MKRILIPLLCFLTSTLLANTYYVSTSGSDSNNGLSTTTPWRTIQYAESHATAPGDIIALKKGDVWASTIVLAITHGGAAGNPITWDGSLWGSGSNASIKSSGNRGDPNNAIVNFITSGCKYVTFKNIVVDANNTLTFGIVIGYIGMSNYSQNGEHDITVDGCSILNVGNGSAYRQGFLCATWNNAISNITIQNCLLDGADDEQLTFYCGRSDENATPAECSNIVIRNNTLTNWGRRGQSTGYGMQINNKCTNVLIEGNTLIQGPNGKGDAFHIESNEPIAGWYPTGVIIRYNKFSVGRTNEWCFIVQKGQAMSITVYSNVFIHTSTSNTTGGNIWIISNGNYTGAKLNFYNNTFFTRSGRTYEDDSRASGVCAFKNNIIYHAGTLGTDYPVIISSAGSTVHSNNLYYRLGTGDNLLVSEGGNNKYKSTVQTWEPTAKKDDPLFKNINGLDFTLQKGSCAIGGGLSIPTLEADIVRKTFANPPSIGCYETSASSPATVVPVYVGSAIQNAYPDILEITYSSSLAAITPAASAFNVLVNAVARTVRSVLVSGTKVSLALVSPVRNGDFVTVSYTKPATNPLQTISGGQASTFGVMSVTNNVNNVNTPPAVTLNYNPSNYAGFIGELDASKSSDNDKDNLIFEWTALADIEVSSVSGPVIKFLAPLVTETESLEFLLKVSDKKSIQSKTISIDINPYKPQSTTANITKVVASDFIGINDPDNIIDNNTGTLWSSEGINQWMFAGCCKG